MKTTVSRAQRATPVGVAVTAQIRSGADPGDSTGLGPVVSGPDLSGSWRPNQLVLESQTAAGDLADFGGVPLNDAARLYALSWPASRQTVRQHQCMGYVTPYFWYAPANYRIWQERDPVYPTAHGVAFLRTGGARRSHRLYGRSSPSACLCAAHLRRLLDRGLSGQHPGCHDNASQTRLDQSQWRAAERRGDRGGALHPPR